MAPSAEEVEQAEEQELADALKAWGIAPGGTLEAWNSNSAATRGVGSRPHSAAGETRPSQKLRANSSAPQLRSGGHGPDRRPASRGGGTRQVWVDAAEAEYASDTGDEEPAFRRHVGRPAELDDRIVGAGSRPQSRGSQAGSRPGSRQASRKASEFGFSTFSTADASSRATSGRFTNEELQCFKRVPTPSSNCEMRSQDYFSTGQSGALRNQLMAENWHVLPVLKGKFYQHPKLKEAGSSPSSAEKKAGAREKARRLLAERRKAEEAEVLPQEAPTATILDHIYPKNPKKDADEEPKEIAVVAERQKPMLDITKMHERKTSNASKGQGGRQRTGARSPSTSNSPKAGREMSGSPKNGRGVGAPSFGLRGASTAAQRSRGGPVAASGGAAADAGVAGAAAKGGEAGASSGARADRPNKREAMQEFRKKLLERFSNVKEAFEAFARDMPESRSLTKKEMDKVLAKHGLEWANREERDLIFDQLDFKGDGHVTMHEFHVSIEASAPVRKIEDLRRRWLASGYGSMHQALMVMVDQQIVALSHRLQLPDFAERLSRVNVMEPSEHLAVFNAICIDKEKGRVSVAELACAVAVVSPGLLLEDVRDRLVKKYSGDLDKAFGDLDMDMGGSVDEDEFAIRATKGLGLSENEARKSFRGIDVDGSGEVSQSEFLSAIGLSEPSLFLEDLRIKVRQRFHSFQAQLAGAFQDSITADLNSQPQLKLARFQELLLPLEMTESETRALFMLIDADHDGELTVREFVRGVTHFAPSSALEDLRLKCSQMTESQNVLDCFAQSRLYREDPTRLLDLEGFTQQLIILGLYDEPVPGNDFESELATDLAAIQSGVRPEAIFDFLDVANRGEASLARLAATLQSCGAGASIKLSPEDLDVRVKQEVRGDMAIMYKLVGDIKMQARQGMRYTEHRENEVGVDSWGKSGTNIVDALLEQESDQGAVHSPKASKMSRFLRGSSGKKGARTPAAASPKAASPSPQQVQQKAPQRTKEQTASHHPKPRNGEEKLSQFQRKLVAAGNTKPMQNAAVGAQKSWGKLWQNLHKSPGQTNRLNLEVSLQGYFQAATSSLSHDGPLVHGTDQSRVNHYDSVKAHQQALRPPLLQKQDEKAKQDAANKKSLEVVA
mmetsp:Transcript_9547/g.17071  ORF Transcript_9547/g.17071 Transcript_9547/m.17071 type:complete len:1127 (+) Transcript_9547:67-3447(+)|eukprot:CAMPEP_0197627134 /NCGR_PEP_ID=MMETSP1338-20131121/5823_1 /TAXON_ID=43686 ORGANISM="Pelagodinium beii, Strain RCC1491" /NCGR_SAMPLE_ID=MMETSP1338 /ASSEMBLY_ACC=CAM_ASM_000754 /LENGTH=1126 /DNA_ID=CAMNT_0043197767 /DNA_START=58 /DNA_END=3438 /DNA_ORIENTATION=+